jgi:hypothetical protein
MRDPETQSFHDLRLVGPSASYDRLRDYRGVRRVRTITAMSGHVLRSMFQGDNVDEIMSAARVGRDVLLGPGGVAITDVNKQGGQWDGDNTWAYSDRVWVEKPVELAAWIAASHPREADELIDISREAREASLNGARASTQCTRTVTESNHARRPGARPESGEYSKNPENPKSPQNFAMSAEGVIANDRHDANEQFEQLVAASGRLLVRAV